MAEYINKNGLVVGASSREVFEEIMRGTGFVMGPNVSLYVENAGLHDKNIVVSRKISPRSSEESKKFPSNQFQKAYDLFNIWNNE